MQVHIPVRRNRSIETTATLYDANNTILFQYTVRTVSTCSPLHPRVPARVYKPLNRILGGSLPRTARP